MDRSGWLRFVAVLALVFVASVAVGAWVGRQRSAPTVGSSATPPPAPSVAVSPSSASVPPTIPPTVPPTARPTPTVAPVATPEPTLTLDPATAEEFAADLLAAFQTGNTQYLADRLHPAVFQRYGEQQCRTHVATFTADPSSSWTFVASTPGSWIWETDAFATIIPDAWSVTVDEPETGKRDLHFAPSQGEWRWFLDCGDPIGGG